MNFWVSSLILSALFGAAHLGNPNENAFGILQVVVIGMIFCLTILHRHAVARRWFSRRLGLGPNIFLRHRR
jgi:membrane protease YdiL (CAAX protease family)